MSIQTNIVIAGQRLSIPVIFAVMEGGAMSVSETLICPHCGKVQYTHEPDDIGTYYCLEECEHCGELFWYSIEVSRSYSVMDYDQIEREDMRNGETKEATP